MSGLSNLRLSALAIAACALGACSAPGDQMNDRPAARPEQNWQVLFDGTDLGRWRGFRRQDVPAGWRTENGVLAFVPGEGGGDLITREQFGDFELELEWKASPGGNSGIFYRATEQYDEIYWSAAEYQVLDNAGHPDGRSALTSAGANYALYAPAVDASRPAGEWNHARIVARGARVQHWLNGKKIVDYEQWSDDWKARVAKSKFAEWPLYGIAARGHIGLQDHGDLVWYRNIRIRRLNP